MGSEEKSCEKTERKETLNDKSLLDGPNLVNENPYGVKLESSQVEKEKEKWENTLATVRNDYALTNINSNLFSGVSLL